MINYRELFNRSNCFLLIIIIIVILSVLVYINKDFKNSIKLISNICIIVGIVSACISMLLYIIINYFIIYDYKIFIDVIASTLYMNLFYLSLVYIGISLILRIVEQRLNN